MKNKATSVSFFLCLFLLAWSATAIAQIDQKQLKKHIYFLASDKMKGRGTGSKEVRKAADYVEKHFKKIRPQAAR